MARRPRSPTSGYGRAFEGALQAGLSVAIAVVLGYYADRWLETEPFLLFFFMIVGGIAGFRRLLRIGAPTDTGPPDSSGDRDEAGP